MSAGNRGGDGLHDATSGIALLLERTSSRLGAASTQHVRELVSEGLYAEAVDNIATCLEFMQSLESQDVVAINAILRQLGKPDYELETDEAV